MRFNNITELGEFVDKVYESTGGTHSKYDALFQKITGGCHCFPPTEWFGDIYLVLKRVLDENAIIDEALAKQAEEVILHFEQVFISDI